MGTRYWRRWRSCIGFKVTRQIRAMVPFVRAAAGGLVVHVGRIVGQQVQVGAGGQPVLVQVGAGLLDRQRQATQFPHQLGCPVGGVEPIRIVAAFGPAVGAGLDKQVDRRFLLQHIQPQYPGSEPVPALAQAAGDQYLAAPGPGPREQRLDVVWVGDVVGDQQPLLVSGQPGQGPLREQFQRQAGPQLRLQRDGQLCQPPPPPPPRWRRGSTRPGSRYRAG